MVLSRLVVREVRTELAEQRPLVELSPQSDQSTSDHRQRFGGGGVATGAPCPPLNSARVRDTNSKVPSLNLHTKTVSFASNLKAQLSWISRNCSDDKKCALVMQKDKKYKYPSKMLDCQFR